jgi:hypothetical protein
LVVLAGPGFVLAQAKSAAQPVTISAQALPATHPAMQSPQAASVLTATSITMKVQAAPAMTALAELSKQSGYEIRPYDARQTARGPSVSVEAVAQPFWAVLREICAKGNLNLYNNGGDTDRRIQIAPSNWGGQGMMKASASIKGPFMCTLSNLERINNVDMSKPGEVSRSISVQMNVFVEPKVHATQVSYQPVVDEAVDENGNSMVPEHRGDEHSSMQSGRGISWYASLTLPYPKSNPGHRIAKLSGHIGATLQLQSEPMEIDDPLNAAETTKSIGGRHFTFKSLKKEGDRYMLEIVFYRDGRDQQEFSQAFNESPSIKLTDAKGRAYRFYNSGGNGDGETITRRFTLQKRSRDAADAPGEPVKLVIEVPTATQNVPIPFELIDLPMP